MRNYAIGIDVGGTQIKLGLFDENMQLLSEQRFLTDKDSTAVELMNFLDQQVRAMVERHFEQTGHEVLIEVDGGIKPANIAEVAAAGANVFVAGSAIYGAGDKAGYEREIRAMREAIATRC